MKNKGFIIILIILLILIILFLTVMLVICLTCNQSFKIGFMQIGSKSSNIIYDKTFELENINSIEVKQDAGDVIFKETSNDYIQVVLYGNKANDFKVNTTNNVLDIDYTNNHRFVLFNFGSYCNDIIIYIPSSYSNTIKIKNDYGQCEMTDLENATFDIDCDAGNVNLGKVKNAIIKCDYGNVEIKEILNKCDIKADCGNIEIDKISIQENSTIKADLGNVDINGTNDIYIDAEVDLGQKNINKNNRTSNITLKIDCDCGNITVGE